MFINSHLRIWFGSSDSFREDAADSKNGIGDRERPDLSEHGPIDRTTMTWPSCNVKRFLRFAETFSGCVTKGVNLLVLNLSTLSVRAPAVRFPANLHRMHANRKRRGAPILYQEATDPGFFPKTSSGFQFLVCRSCVHRELDIVTSTDIHQRR